ncbi:hypothetical protein FIBSPDRAFT_876321 [Athelia psychrophila]|uniref:Uncharacterized protein n=1 Tax=Athelia psychrophila TaxID=1759441 RepID=A0A167WZB3_9AGAM|nr:hypothetical protein FIBSPDRAFT_876321 [Fibularhizoctonia sp. CBS 109695]
MLIRARPLPKHSLPASPQQFQLGLSKPALRLRKIPYCLICVVRSWQVEPVAGLLQQGRVKGNVHSRCVYVCRARVHMGVVEAGRGCSAEIIFH